MLHRDLSKSKLIAFRQCSKRLWLEVHQPQRREDSKSTLAIFRTGHQVGEIAQRLYDPQGDAVLIDLHAEGVNAAMARTRQLLGGDVPIFEAGFSANGALAFADILLPTFEGGEPGWRMVEVKSSTSVKDYHQDDIAIQSYVARASGVRLTGVALAHIDTGWTYPGDGDYRGLLVEKDLTASAFARAEEVESWIQAAHAVVAMDVPPAVLTGKHCNEPFACGFSNHCQQGQAVAEFPVEWLPRIQSGALKSYISGHAVVDMREVPDPLLNARQRRVRNHTVSAECYFDTAGAQNDLLPHPLPGYFLDFETIRFGVPIWSGTRPFQPLPFQFSLHRLDQQGNLSHQGFLDLSGKDPSLAFAQNLVVACGEPGPIFVYNAAFEGTRIRELARRFQHLQLALLALMHRLVDLRPIAEARFYHPGQQGSWSIKKVLPAIAPALRYDQLAGVQDGDMAMQAYLEAIEPATLTHRKQQIRAQLESYCALDTLAMVKLWGKFSGVDLPTRTT